MGKIWTVCSGSGGVGKTTIALSIAVGAAKAGKKTILLDASGASRSCDLVLGLESIVTLDLMNVLAKQIHMESALYPVMQYENLYLACSSLYDRTPVSELSRIVLALYSLCDILVIDMPTGQSFLGRGVMRTGDERLLITRPDNASIRATERLLAHCSADDAISSLVINHASRERIKRKTQYTQDTVQNLLDMPVMACIPEDASIPEGESHARAAIECDGPAWTALSNLSKALLAGV
ncbi:MAG: septum site-determining protein MinD [Clostridiales bacterium]|nr:septum site-determining protein MinD [Clostridiales bacterium]